MGNRVLVVVDGADMREITATALQYAGFEVLTAASANEALSRCAGGDPDVIVLDLGLAGLGAAAFVITYRAIPMANARIIVMSNGGAERAAAEMHCDLGLSMPFSMDEVVAAVRHLTTAAA